MYGINLITVGQILGASLAKDLFFSKHGAVYVIYQQILKYTINQDIEMTKFMMQTLARQNEQAYDDIMTILKKNLSDEEFQNLVNGLS